MSDPINIRLTQVENEVHSLRQRVRELESEQLPVQSQQHRQSFTILYPSKKQRIQHCPNGHNLTPYDIFKSNMYCDMCNKPLLINSVATSCRLCDYDICQTCM